MTPTTGRPGIAAPGSLLWFVPSVFSRLVGTIILGAVPALLTPSLVANECHLHASSPRDAIDKRSGDTGEDDGHDGPRVTLATLANTHTGELAVLDTDGPSGEAFAALLRDRATGRSQAPRPRACSSCCAR